MNRFKTTPEKFIKTLEHKTDPPFTGKPFDVVIPIFGITGVGKSTFINDLLRSIGMPPSVAVGHGLESCTSYLTPVVIPFNQITNGFKNPNPGGEGRLVIVDTPGFDDTHIPPMEILRRIAVWLGFSHVGNMRLAGVIYLHSIAENGGNIRDTVKVFNTFWKLIGQDAERYLVFGTTKWALLDDPRIGVERERNLKEQYWQCMIKKGTQVVSIRDQNAAPRQIIDSILNRASLTNSKVEFLQIQSELVHMRKRVPATEAGKSLSCSLEELIKRYQNAKLENLTDDDFERGRKEVDKLLKAANKLKVPLGTRIMRFFGF